VRIGILITVPPAASQDAFGANYRTGQTRWQYKRNQHRVVERLKEKYRGKEKEHIWLVPTHLNLDCRHNFPTRESKWNAHIPAKGIRLNNGVHPSSAGYYQIGDSIYCWLKAVL
jgi:hypothetical protein